MCDVRVLLVSSSGGDSPIFKVMTRKRLPFKEATPPRSREEMTVRPILWHVLFCFPRVSFLLFHVFKQLHKRRILHLAQVTKQVCIVQATRNTQRKTRVRQQTTTSNHQRTTHSNQQPTANNPQPTNFRCHVGSRHGTRRLVLPRDLFDFSWTLHLL